MRKFVFLLLSVQCCFAGFKAAGKPVRLVSDIEMNYMNPRWAPDGQKIAFTSENYCGLWIIKSDGTGMQQMSADTAAGFGFQWSHDGTVILSRVAKWEGPVRYNAIKVFDLTNTTSKFLTGYRLGLNSLPQWAPDDANVLFYSNGRSELVASGRPPHAALKKAASRMCYLQNDRLAFISLENNTSHLISATKDLCIINLVVSPNEQQIAFEILGGPLCVINSDGSNLIKLGKGNRPQWSPDGQYLVYMIAQDDGHRIISSDLYTTRVDGNERQQLTFTSEIKEMNPNWAPEGDCIVYDVMDSGEIYLLSVAKE